MKCFLHLCPAGVSPSERGLVWRFLFGMYPCSSTALERSLLHEQLVIRYRVMKRKWQSFLPSAVRMHLNGTDGKRPEPCAGCIPSIGLIFLSWTNNPASFPAELVQAVRYFDQRPTQTLQRTQDQSEDVKDRLAFLQLQAQVSIQCMSERSFEVKQKKYTEGNDPAGSRCVTYTSCETHR